MVKKTNKKHNFKHLEKIQAISKRAENNVVSDKDNSAEFGNLVPLGRLIDRDLRNTAILIALIVLTVLALGVVVYKTELLSPLLSRFQIRY